MVNLDERATEAQRIEIRSKFSDPNYCRANEILRQIESHKTERTKLRRQADQYTERIDSLEAEFHKLVLELEPTEVVTSKKSSCGRDDGMHKRIRDALASRLADNPSLEEQLAKILKL